MEYKILKDFKKGILLTRQPEIVSDELIITFSGAPDNAVAIFESYATGNSIYRSLTRNSCSIPVDFLKGDIGIVVTNMDDRLTTPVFVCEGLKAEQIGGGVIIAPDDGDLPRIVAGIQFDMQEIKTELRIITQKYSELNKKVTELLEGCDII